nr:MAG TPA: hypothetical protein [Caudoviricetes sp.]
MKGLFFLCSFQLISSFFPYEFPLFKKILTLYMGFSTI